MLKMYIPLKFDGKEVVQATVRPDIAILTSNNGKEHTLLISCKQYIDDSEYIVASVILEADSELDGYYTAERSSVTIVLAYPYICSSIQKIENIRIYTAEVLNILGKTQVEDVKIDVLSSEYNNMNRIYQSIMKKAIKDISSLLNVMP